ncbi:hypothetical protein [Enterobacter cancerogenus]|uniref:hypothetical protein n=1 Tax=Enterobacter cancerogenus TaxID=69218 RepID=UPI0005391D3A|nr:hypothetical protein [Enterobacter cancerogenus]KGT89926.1 hypothetical protein NH00_15120 [Enterobacter cancerogenus]
MENRDLFHSSHNFLTNGTKGMRLLRVEAMTHLRPSKGPLEEQSVRAMDKNAGSVFEQCEALARLRVSPMDGANIRAADLHGCVIPLRSGGPLMGMAPNSQHPTHSTAATN